MFKYISDKLIVKLALAFGFPDENLEDEREIHRLKKSLLEEKLRNQEDNKQEITVLRQKVEQLTDDKIFLLEQEIVRLQKENHEIKKLASPTPHQQLSQVLHFEQIERFAYHNGIVKYALYSGDEYTLPLSEQSLLLALKQSYPLLSFQIEESDLVVLAPGQVVQSYPLYQMISTSLFKKYHLLEQ